MRNHHGKDEDWGDRGTVALRVATLLTVLAVVAFGATSHHPDELVPPLAQSASPASDEPYYFPGEYDEFKAPPDTDYQAPTL